MLLLLLSHFSHVRLCATPLMAAYQALPSLGFSRQEHWSGVPFPSPMRESEAVQSCPTLSDPMDCSLPGSSVHGIFQARVLEMGDQSLGREDPLEKEMATHSSTRAWRIPWTEEPGRLQSMGSQRVRHN